MGKLTDLNAAQAAVDQAVEEFSAKYKLLGSSGRQKLEENLSDARTHRGEIYDTLSDNDKLYATLSVNLGSYWADKVHSNSTVTRANLPNSNGETDPRNGSISLDSGVYDRLIDGSALYGNSRDVQTYIHEIVHQKMVGMPDNFRANVVKTFQPQLQEARNAGYPSTNSQFYPEEILATSAAKKILRDSLTSSATANYTDRSKGGQDSIARTQEQTIDSNNLINQLFGENPVQPIPLVTKDQAGNSLDPANILTQLQELLFNRKYYETNDQ